MKSLGLWNWKMIRSLNSSFLSLSKSQVQLAASFVQKLQFHNGRIIPPGTELTKDGVALPSDRNSVYRFRTFCTSKTEDFSKKKCIPCDTKDMRPMQETVANNLMNKVPEWELAKENGIMKLRRSMKTKTFLKALELFRRIGELAESEGHHPDLHLVGWNNVTIEIWTHAVGGLTENDFILAAKIGNLNIYELLRRRPSSP